jgi:hypothetical protein
LVHRLAGNIAVLLDSAFPANHPLTENRAWESGSQKPLVADKLTQGLIERPGIAENQGWMTVFS